MHCFFIFRVLLAWNYIAVHPTIPSVLELKKFSAESRFMFVCSSHQNVKENIRWLVLVLWIVLSLGLVLVFIFYLHTSYHPVLSHTMFVTSNVPHLHCMAYEERLHKDSLTCGKAHGFIHGVNHQELGLRGHPYKGLQQGLWKKFCCSICLGKNIVPKSYLYLIYIAYYLFALYFLV